MGPAEARPAPGAMGGPGSAAEEVPEGRLLGVLVTYRRLEQLHQTLDRLAGQARTLDRLVVVDNAPDPETEAAARGYGARGLEVEYVPAPENIGPAGGIALGMRRLLEDASDDDWIATLDDDDPPWSPDLLRHQEAFARRALAADPRTAGVGLVGARFDWRRGQMIRLPDRELRGRVPVDSFGGGHLPVYRAGAVRHVGPFREDLFWGLEELEFGLRLRRAGYFLYVDGDLWSRRRAEVGRAGLDIRPSLRLAEPTWRSYYGLRNAVFVLRWHGRRGAAWRVTLLRGFAKPLANLPRSPRAAARHLALSWRAARDGWTGRMGRTVDPEGGPPPR